MLQRIHHNERYRAASLWLILSYGGVGDVANNIDDLILKDYKYSYGFGFRYIFDEKERLTVRADFGFGKNTSGVDFAMQEAY